MQLQNKILSFDLRYHWDAFQGGALYLMEERWARRVHPNFNNCLEAWSLPNIGYPYIYISFVVAVFKNEINTAKNMTITDKTKYYISLADFHHFL